MKTVRRQKKNNEFVQRLQALFSGQPVTAVANRLGIDQPAMTRYLQGDISPGYKFFSKVARVGVDTNWLLAGRKVTDERSVDQITGGNELQLQ